MGLQSNAVNRDRLHGTVKMFVGHLFQKYKKNINKSTGNLLLYRVLEHSDYWWKTLAPNLYGLDLFIYICTENQNL